MVSEVSISNSNGVDPWGGYKLAVARTQRVIYHFYGEKKQCLFTLRSLHLQFMKGNKIFVRNLGDRPFSGEILTPKERLSQIGIQDKKIIILINSQHFTMDFFFYFQGQDVQHKRSYISFLHR